MSEEKIHAAPLWCRAAFLVAVVTGLLLLAALYDDALGTAILIAAAIATLGALLWRNAYLLTQAEEELMASREKLAVTLDSIGDAVLATDAAGSITRLNTVAEKLTGWSQAEAAGRPVGEVFCIIDEQTRQPAVSNMGEALGKGTVSGLTRRSVLIARDGTERPIAESGAPIRGGGGQMLGAVLVFRDVSEERRAEAVVAGAQARLLSANHFLDSLIENIPAMIFVKDATDLRFIRINRTEEEWLGWSRDELLGKGDYDFFPKEQADLFTAKDREVLAHGTVHDIPEETIQTRDHGLRILHTKKVPIFDEHGRPRALLGISEDITERKEKEREILRLNAMLEQRAAQLEQSSQMKSEFLATMSHELRTPLNAIIGFSEVLFDGLAGELSVQQREHVDDIRTAGEHLLALINDILDLSKIEAGKMSLDLEPVEMQSLLNNALSMVKEKALAHRLRLSLKADQALPTIWVDSRKLKQILYNLLSNAVKFTPEGGSVTLSARRAAGPAGDELEIAVADTGIGIAPEDHARLFQPFVQVDSSFAKSFQGTGLGLAMVKRLAELHGGRVALESAVDKGATVSVWLPYRTDDAPKAEEIRPAPSRSLKRAKPLALVIEDKDEAWKLLRLQLEDEGLAVLRAADAETGLLLARERLPDIITLDVLLPGMDGWDFLAALKMDARVAAIPVVIVSIAADEKKGLALGAALVLQKPIDRRQLSAALAASGLRPLPGRTATALVVDDDPKAVEILRAFLEDAGCRVVQAIGGREGIAQARVVHPDLVILDLMMPEVSGFDVIAALRADAATRAIPIIVMTAKIITMEDRATLHGSVVRVLQKSEFSRERFLEEVRRALPAAQEA